MNSRRLMGYPKAKDRQRSIAGLGADCVPCITAKSVADVRDGSNPVLRVFPPHVRLGAASGIPSGALRCRTRAKLGHWPDYSITPSARTKIPIHPLGSSSPPRPIHDKLLIAISE